MQGNLKFVVDGDTPLIENGKVVSIIADLLSTKPDMVEKALLYRTVAAGRDVIDKQHTEQEASYGRDAFAKVGFSPAGCRPGKGSGTEIANVVGKEVFSGTPAGGPPVELPSNTV